MKKLLVVLMIAVMLVTLCACSYVPSDRFMSSIKVNSLAKTYENPQAQLTLNYTVNSNDVEVKIIYNLQLKKTPIATVRFIQLVQEGFYDGAFLENYNSSYHYMTLGRYVRADSLLQENKTVYLQNPSDVTFKGEFKSNGYKEPDGGYAQFQIMSLAMYHDDWTETNNTFDDANGYLIMAMANQTLNSDNYAVFAQMDSISYKIGEGEYGKATAKVPSTILSNLTGFTAKTSRTVYDDDSEVNSSSVSLMSTVVRVHFEMLGDYDWSKLPQIGK